MIFPTRFYRWRVMHLKHPADVLFRYGFLSAGPSTIGEMKTKPTQNAVRQLNAYGGPARHHHRALDAHARQEAERESSPSGATCRRTTSFPRPTWIPSTTFPEFRARQALRHTHEPFWETCETKSRFSEWKRFVEHAHNGNGVVKIGIVGKYFDTGDFVLSDAYFSVIEAIISPPMRTGCGRK